MIHMPFPCTIPLEFIHSKTFVNKHLTIIQCRSYYLGLDKSFGAQIMQQLVLVLGLSNKGRLTRILGIER